MDISGNPEFKILRSSLLSLLLNIFPLLVSGSILIILSSNLDLSINVLLTILFIKHDSSSILSYNWAWTLLLLDRAESSNISKLAYLLLLLLLLFSILLFVLSILLSFIGILLLIIGDWISSASVFWILIPVLFFVDAWEFIPYDIYFGLLRLFLV